MCLDSKEWRILSRVCSTVLSTNPRNIRNHAGKQHEICSAYVQLGVMELFGIIRCRPQVSLSPADVNPKDKKFLS